MYYAIIGDIIDSKRIDNEGRRGEVQERLSRILGEINQEYSDQLASNMTITLGDEFQGLLKDSSCVMLIIDRIREFMCPVEIRFGIGVGDITTRIDRELAIGADGPAYYAARAVVEELKATRLKFKKEAPEIGIDYMEAGGRHPDEETTAGREIMEILEDMNLDYTMLRALEADWSTEQAQTIWLSQRERLTQTELANKLGVNQSTIQRRLGRGNLLAYEKVRQNIERKMKHLEKVVSSVK